MNYNKVIICGRVTKDIELKKTNEGRAVVSLVLATNNTYVDKNNNKVDKADFHNIVIWGTMAETVAKYCVKGSVLLVEGRLQNRNFEGRDGVKKFVTEVVAEKFQFGPKPSGASQAGTAVSNQVTNHPEEPRDDEEIRVENIPF